jgi:hypothetical protein
LNKEWVKMSQHKDQAADGNRSGKSPAPAKPDDRKPADGERQVDDNQDDLGRDVNDPGRIANEINRTGH